MVPRRPRGIPKGAVFLWAPPVGLPAPRRGDWVHCWQQPNWGQDRCRLSTIDGTALFEDDYIPDQGGAPVPRGELQIDPVGTDFLWVGDTQVPVVHLKNGKLLIPARYAKFLGDFTKWGD